MSRIKNLRIGVLVLLFALVIGGLSQLYDKTNIFAANTLPGSNEVITIATTDSQPVNAAIYPAAYSGDGNVILFTSGATNLSNANTYWGLYTYDIRSNTTTRVDVSTSGVLPNGNAGGQGGLYNISETGRFVLFQSRATNLIDGTTSYKDQTYKRDLQAGTTTNVINNFGSSTGAYQNTDYNLGISNDGRFVLAASRYTANSYPNSYGIIYGDSGSGAYNWTSLGNLNYSGVDDMYLGGLNCDGSFAVFQSYGAIKLADLRTGSATTISVGSSSSTSPAISCNGNYVLYVTGNRTDITPTPAGLNTYLHLVIYNRITGERKYIDSNSAGVFHNNPNYSSSLSRNVFSTSIANTGDVVFKYNGNVYLKHLSDGSGTLESIAKKANGTYVNVTNGQITSDGRYVFFQADPYDLGLTSSPSSSQIIRAKTGL